MKVRWNPKQQRFPALRGNVVVDTFRGQIRVRKWPRKRGKPTHPATIRQNTWFKEANQLAKRIWPDQMSLAMAMTKGTGLYPRDLILRQMSGGIYDLYMPDGRHYLPTSMPREAIMFQGAILNLTANQALTAGAQNVITWPLPVLDTMGFWNILTPTRLTIQPGVEFVELKATWSAISAAGANRTAIFFKKNGALGPTDWREDTGSNSATVVYPANPVVTGDFFEVVILPSLARTAEGSIRTSFTLTALQVVT